MTNPDSKPSPKQLSYLRHLAESTGQSFAWPQTSAAASVEINCLLEGKRTSHVDRRREIRQVRDDMARGGGGAARVRPEELGGYNSSAHWRGA
jgi:hypothetical protein